MDADQEDFIEFTLFRPLIKNALQARGGKLYETDENLCKIILLNIVKKLHSTFSKVDFFYLDKIEIIEIQTQIQMEYSEEESSSYKYFFGIIFVLFV